MYKRVSALWTLVALLIVYQCFAAPSSKAGKKSAKKNAVELLAFVPDNRTDCPDTPPAIRPPNRVDTAQQVRALRNAMKMHHEDVHAYLTLISDDHATAGSGWDQRVEFISGFSGSNGFTIVTETEAALWTDGRYFLQAEYQLDCDWKLMKIATAGYPDGPQWLLDVLPANSRVGAYPNYVSIDIWQDYAVKLSAKNITMVRMTPDLVDEVWSNSTIWHRPPKPNNPLIVHTINFTGETSINKVRRVRAELEEEGADCLVVTQLDEVAWLFNLRGSDHANSQFYGYALVYTNRRSKLFVNNLSSLDLAVLEHLNLNSTGHCKPGILEVDCVELKNYADILIEIRADLSTDMWMDPLASYAIYEAVGEKIFSAAKRSPIALMKAIKNEVEQKRFYDCIMRDSAAVVEFVSFLEKQIAAGVRWTEITASEELKKVRSQYEYNKGVSFDTISAVGKNAAVIHYRPTTDTDRNITDKEIYLLDSGGQYLDGTTDVTRTFHFGIPTDREKEAYTRVLMGSIDLAMTVWPDGTYGRDIDGRARTPLWQNGWNYNHGTGHGIGYFLNVHEGPGRINIGYDPMHTKLYEGMFFSDEPGYYEDESFGVRLETLVGVVDAKTPNNFDGKKYMTFQSATLVPFEPKLIKYELLSVFQIKWLDDYHKSCEEQTGKYLLEVRKDEAAYEWLRKRTAASPSVSAAVTLTSSLIAILCAINIAIFNLFYM